MTVLDSRKGPVNGTAPRYPETHQRNGQGYPLAHAIESRAQSVTNDAIHPVSGEDGIPLDSRLLLALLACCYACETYRSADVATAIRNDTTFCRRCLGVSPDARTIRRFRRQNREALEACLVAGLRVLAEQKLAAGLIHRVCETSLAEEAHRRITTAMFIDSMELNPDHTRDIPGYLFGNGRPLGA